MKITQNAFLDSPNKAVTLMGMSGVGKTTMTALLHRDQWFHYSGDYRIGTKYLEEPILDNIKRQAMQVPFLSDLIRSDSIYFSNNITVENLKPISSFLGKIGNPQLGGISLLEFKRRQALHRAAEANAMTDVADFIDKAQEIYGYPHFINDTGGSVCELTDEEAWDDLAQRSIIIYLKADEHMETAMFERAKADPKPLYYDTDFLDQHVEEFLVNNNLVNVEQMVPDEFVQWVFPKLLAYRKPLYEGIANKHGYTIDASGVLDLKTQADVLEFICSALD
jgi:hypothetical protein